jgi:DNA-binding response OmpR family regulator
MADVKHILVVDDHFDMLEFLRSMLQLSSQDYEVLAVPSAEEGLMELRRGHFDLLITDVRLPGISGFELVRQMHRLKLTLPVIMITAYSSAQGQKEARDLGVFQYFQKPLDTDDVLTAVTRALHGDAVNVPIAPATTSTSFQLTEDLRKRLETLRVDTGALQLLLSAINGQVLHTVGGGPRLDLDKLATIVARNVSDSFLLAKEIGSREPFTLQYHAGARLELYCANVGEQYFLTMFFDAAARRGRIGTIWVFTQRAIKDIQAILPIVAPTAVAPVSTRPSSTAPTASKTVPPPVTKPPQRQMETPLPDPPTPVMAKAAQPTAEPEEIALVPAENLPVNITIIGDGVQTNAQTEEMGTAVLDMNAAELQALLAGGLEETAGEVDLDAFWDDALTFTETESQPAQKGLTIEEASKQGLIDLPE